MVLCKNEVDMDIEEDDNDGVVCVCGGGGYNLYDLTSTIALIQRFPVCLMIQQSCRLVAGKLDF